MQGLSSSKLLSSTQDNIEHLTLGRQITNQGQYVASMFFFFFLNHHKELRNTRERNNASLLELYFILHAIYWAALAMLSIDGPVFAP